MTAVLGFIALHLLLIGLGMVALHVAGLADLKGWSAPTLCLALGPGFVAGVALLMPWLVIALLLKIPLTFGTAAVAAVVGTFVLLLAGRLVARRGRPAAPAPRPETHPGRDWAGTKRRPVVLVGAAAGAFTLWGAVALARSPTRGDDARIWSLRGLTLAYYGRLQPEIFLNPLQAGAHPVYPLLQPGLEAVLSSAVGEPALAFFHTELWLLLVAAVWTAGFLIWRADFRPSSGSTRAWVAAVALLAVVPVVVNNVIIGDADTTGSVFLGLGVLCIGLWLDSDKRGYVALAAVLLTAAGSTKDEDLVASILVIVVAFAIVVCRAALGRSSRTIRSQLVPLVLAGIYFAALSLPWRLWLHAHHLTDSVEPPIPRALNPIYFLGRGTQLRETLTAMLAQTLQEWDWLAALFIVVCGICIASGRGRRVAAFYLATFAGLVLALLWLYTTTPLSLGFLLPTSMDRTVGVFMVMTPFAIAHLMSASGRSRPDASQTAVGGP